MNYFDFCPFNHATMPQKYELFYKSYLLKVYIKPGITGTGVKSKTPKPLVKLKRSFLSWTDAAYERQIILNTNLKLVLNKSLPSSEFKTITCLEDPLRWGIRFLEKNVKSHFTPKNNKTPSLTNHPIKKKKNSATYISFLTPLLLNLHNGRVKFRSI